MTKAEASYIEDADRAWQESHQELIHAAKHSRQWAALAGCMRGVVMFGALHLTTHLWSNMIGYPALEPVSRPWILVFMPIVLVMVFGGWAYLERCAGRSASRYDWLLYSRDSMAMPSFQMLPELHSNAFMPQAPTETTPPFVKRSTRIGAPMAEWWPDFVAELVAYTAEVGLPDGIGHQGQSEVIREVFARMAERGKAEPSRTQIQETVNAVLRRMRSAGK